jgi:quinolinate synthase
MHETPTLLEKLARLKAQRNAVILAHNYQLPEVQDAADFTGDSLELSYAARDAAADVIVFCGVHFMAETAAILSPGKTVLLPDESAGCPMADMITAADVAALRAKHPGASIVCYVNSTAAVKAACDVCCTSSNAVDVVSRLPLDREVVFVPDKYLGAHVQRKLGRALVLWPGYCPTHARLLTDHVAAARTAHPGAPVLVHPESRAEVAAAADEVMSTGGMVRFARETTATTVVVGTETGMLHRLRKENPRTRFVPLYDGAVCENMKKTDLAKVIASLEEMAPRVEVPAGIAEGARAAVTRMLESRGEGAAR